MGEEFREQVYTVLEKIIARPLTVAEGHKLQMALVAWVASVKAKDEVEMVYTCRDCHVAKSVPEHTDKFLRNLPSAAAEFKGKKTVYTPALEELRKENHANSTKGG